MYLYASRTETRIHRIVPLHLHYDSLCLLLHQEIKDSFDVQQENGVYGKTNETNKTETRENKYK